MVKEKQKPLRSESTRESILEQYEEVFKPGRGKPLGSPLRIEVDPNVKPVQAPRRRVPAAKLDRVNKELKRLCEEDTIAPVTQPTEWLSNMLVREKLDGRIRICIDPSRTVNNGMCQYLSKFCQNLSETVLPLRNLLKQNVEFNWTMAQESAFVSAKRLIASSASLHYYNVKLPVTLQVDASDEAIGGVLMQEGRPVCFTSHTLNETEKQYAQIEKNVWLS